MISDEDKIDISKDGIETDHDVMPVQNRSPGDDDGGVT